MRRGPIVFFLLLAGCGSSAEDWEAGRPRIDDLAFVQQAPGMPLSLEFTLDFVDSNGDLGPGKVLLSIEGDELASLAMSEIFAAQRPPLAMNATSGKIELLVDLSAPVDAGETITLGFRLQDQAGEQSNEPTITLEAIGDGA